MSIANHRNTMQTILTWCFLAVSSCAPDHGGVARFEAVFEVKLPSSARMIKVNDGKWTDDPRFRFRITPADFEMVKQITVRAGYSEWKKVPDTFTYGFGSFNLEGSDKDPVYVSDKYPTGKGGKHFMLFYRPSTELLEAVSFLN